MSISICNKIGESAITICSLQYEREREVAVYGAECFGWNLVELYLRRASDANREKLFKKVHTYRQFKLLKTSTFSGRYKASLTEIILRNYKVVSNDMNAKFIPVLFCVGINAEILTPKQVMSKGNDYFTNSELRRAIKHCIPEEMFLDPVASELDKKFPGLDVEQMQALAMDVCQIALATFNAIAVEDPNIFRSPSSITNIREVPSFFKNKDYPKLLKERREGATKTTNKSNGWKKQFYTLVLDTTFVPPSLESPLSPTSASSLMSPRSARSPSGLMSPTSASSLMSPTSASPMKISSFSDFPETKEPPRLQTPPKSKWYSKLNPFKK